MARPALQQGSTVKAYPIACENVQLLRAPLAEFDVRVALPGRMRLIYTVFVLLLALMTSAH